MTSPILSALRARLTLIASALLLLPDLRRLRSDMAWLRAAVARLDEATGEVERLRRENARLRGLVDGYRACHAADQRAAEHAEEACVGAQRERDALRLICATQARQVESLDAEVEELAKPAMSGREEPS